MMFAVVRETGLFCSQLFANSSFLNQQFTFAETLKKENIMNTMKTTTPAGGSRLRQLPATLPPAPTPFNRQVRQQQRRLLWALITHRVFRPWLAWPAAITLLLLLFLYSGPLLRLLDPTAAVPDPGLLSVLAFAVLATLVLGLAARLLLWLVTPADTRNPHESYGKTFQYLSPCQKICICAGSYLGCLFAFVGVFTVLL